MVRVSTDVRDVRRSSLGDDPRNRHDKSRTSAAAVVADPTREREGVDPHDAFMEHVDLPRALNKRTSTTTKVGFHRAPGAVSRSRDAALRRLIDSTRAIANRLACPYAAMRSTMVFEMSFCCSLVSA
jgi:hypothetical protein